MTAAKLVSIFGWLFETSTGTDHAAVFRTCPAGAHDMYVGSLLDVKAFESRVFAAVLRGCVF